MAGILEAQGLKSKKTAARVITVPWWSEQENGKNWLC